MQWNRNTKGFSLVEVLVALVIFMVGSLGLLPLLLNGMQTNRHNALHDQARHLASEAMACLQVLDYAALPNSDHLTSVHGEIALAQQVEPDHPATGQTRITVTATWQQRQQEHRYQLQSLRAAP